MTGWSAIVMLWRINPAKRIWILSIGNAFLVVGEGELEIDARILVMSFAFTFIIEVVSYEPFPEQATISSCFLGSGPACFELKYCVVFALFIPWIYERFRFNQFRLTISTCVRDTAVVRMWYHDGDNLDMLSMGIVVLTWEQSRAETGYGYVVAIIDIDRGGKFCSKACHSALIQLKSRGCICMRKKTRLSTSYSWCKLGITWPVEKRSKAKHWSAKSQCMIISLEWREVLPLLPMINQASLCSSAKVLFFS